MEHFETKKGASAETALSPDMQEVQSIIGEIRSSEGAFFSSGDREALSGKLADAVKKLAGTDQAFKKLVVEAVEKQLGTDSEKRWTDAAFIEAFEEYRSSKGGA